MDTPEFIDVGTTYGALMSTDHEGEEPKKNYPCLCIRSDEELDIAKSGTMLVKYRRVERTEEEREEGEPKFRYELEVEGVSPVESEEEVEITKDPTESLEDAFKVARKK